ncbi:GNAT family N-acetyltransferase [Chitinophaga nivalis]|uniref:N-acetyltransferase n=1 Tax=Chitinophaga nivalis TaxID=2991709 RepID=A0ABT3IH66_9BACT|nr:N-acetyltransferase [Chitinophaga nivalis]MCW3467048.1 N-acetyltransferase [Chitinophaga nivalis]MCW3483261.1 N-acetyltransferase [Chitinophaga nivalis]
MNSNHLIIRAATPQDYEAVFNVNKQAFQREDEALLVNELRSSQSFIPALSLVAVTNGIITGYILFTAMTIAQTTHQVVGLAPVAVLPAYQGLGIGGALIRKGLEIASTLGYEAAIVLGHEHYYPKFGFAPAIQWGILPPVELPANNFMAVALQPGALEHISGVAQYAPEFKL